jgi:hypothetical protein
VDTINSNTSNNINIGSLLCLSQLSPKQILLTDHNTYVTSTPLTNGQVLIGSTGSLPIAASLTGTTNEINVTSGSGTITLSTPQAINSTATPTFASETLTSTTNQLTLGTTNTTTINSPAPSSSITLTLPSSASDTIVGRNTTDTLTNKTLTTPIISSISNTGTITVPTTTGTLALVSQIPTNSTYVDLTSAQTIANTKTFSGQIKTTGGVPSSSSTTGDIVVLGGIGTGSNIYSGGQITCPAISSGTGTYSGQISTTGGVASTSTTTGDVVVLGGIGCNGITSGGALVCPTIEADSIIGKTNPNVITYFNGYITEIFGTVTGQSATAAYVTFYQFPTTSGKTYMAETWVSAIFTAGTQINDCRGQWGVSRFKNIGGTVTIVNLFANNDSHDYSESGTNLAVDGTVSTTVDFQFYSGPTGNSDVQSYSYYIKILSSP